MRAAHGPELEIALGYAPAAIRPAFRALFGLDGRLAAAVAAAREPQLGLIRLKWWQEALAVLPDTSRAGGDVLLGDLATVVRDHDVNSETLAGLTDGWAEVLAPFPLEDETLLRFARMRGELLFEIAAGIAGADTGPARRAGAIWALNDLAANLSDGATQAASRQLAGALGRIRLPRPLSSLAILAEWARIEASGTLSPRRRALIAMRIALIGR